MEPQGDRIGGEDFDRALYDHFDELFQKQARRPICIEGVDLHLLKQCRRWKENLSVSERSGPFSWWVPDLRKAIKVEVKRARFEDLIREHVERTIRLTQSLREEALATGCDVSSVILIGGSSRIPLVTRRLQETLQVEPRKWEMQYVAVALGAAYHANHKWGEKRNGRQEIPPPIHPINDAADQYRRAVKWVWRDQVIGRRDLEQMFLLAQQLGLNQQEAAAIERDVMGYFKEVVFDRQMKAGSSGPESRPHEGSVSTSPSASPVPLLRSPQEIHGLIADGQGERAFDVVSKAMLAHPDECLFDLWCDAAMVIADAERVLASCREMYLQRGGDVWSSCCLASALVTLHRIEEAQQVLRPFRGRQFLQFFPVLYVRQEIASSKDDTETCRELLDRLLVMRPNHDTLLACRASLEYALNHVEAAEKLLDRALRLNPNNLVAHFLRILRASAFAEGPEAAIEKIKPELAIMNRIAANHSMTRICRAIYLFATQQPQASLRELNEAARLPEIRGSDGLMALVLQFRAYCHQALNAQDELRRDVEEWVRHDPKTPEARLLRGNLLFAENRYAEALQDFNKARIACPQSVEAWIGSGWCNVNLGQFAEAMNDFVSAYRANPGSMAAKFGATYACTIRVLMEALPANPVNYSVYLSPQIPQDKLANVLQSYAAGHLSADSSIALLFDSTFWGGARDGFCISEDKLLAHNLWASSFAVRLMNIHKVEQSDNDVVVNGFRIECGSLSGKNEGICAFAKLFRALAELHQHLDR